MQKLEITLGPLERCKLEVIDALGMNYFHVVLLCLCLRRLLNESCLVVLS